MPNVITRYRRHRVSFLIALYCQRHNIVMIYSYYHIVGLTTFSAVADKYGSLMFNYPTGGISLSAITYADLKNLASTCSSSQVVPQINLLIPAAATSFALLPCFSTLSPAEPWNREFHLVQCFVQSGLHVHRNIRLFHSHCPSDYKLIELTWLLYNGSVSFTAPSALQAVALDKSFFLIKCSDYTTIDLVSSTYASTTNPTIANCKFDNPTSVTTFCGGGKQFCYISFIASYYFVPTATDITTTCLSDKWALTVTYTCS